MVYRSSVRRRTLRSHCRRQARILRLPGLYERCKRPSGLNRIDALLFSTDSLKCSSCQTFAAKSRRSKKMKAILPRTDSLELRFVVLFPFSARPDLHMVPNSGERDLAADSRPSHDFVRQDYAALLINRNGERHRNIETIKF